MKGVCGSQNQRNVTIRASGIANATPAAQECSQKQDPETELAWTHSLLSYLVQKHVTPGRVVLQCNYVDW